MLEENVRPRKPTNTSEGIDIARTIRSEFPQIGILLLSAHVELETAIDFLQSGERIDYLLFLDAR